MRGARSTGSDWPPPQRTKRRRLRRGRAHFQRRLQRLKTGNAPTPEPVVLDQDLAFGYLRKCTEANKRIWLDRHSRPRIQAAL